MFLSIIDPLGDQYPVPGGSGHRFLLRVMLAQQREAYGSTILEQFSYDILVRNMKLLREKYNDQQILTGIALATNISDYPYSTRLVEDRILWLLALQQSPALSIFDRNRF